MFVFISGLQFYYIDLCVCFRASTILFWLLQLYSTVSSLGAYLQLCSSFSRLLWLFGVSCGSIQILELFFLGLWNAIGIVFFILLLYKLFYSFFSLNFGFIYLFIYLFMAVLGLRCCARAFSSCGEWGSLFIAVHGPLIIVASLVVEHRLQTRRLSSCGSRA